MSRNRTPSRFLWGRRRGTWEPQSIPVEPDPVLSDHPDVLTTSFGDTQGGVPLQVWARPSVTPANEIATSFQYDQYCWVKVTAYVDVNGSVVSVPLMDDNDIPFLGPESPPIVITRLYGEDSGDGDHVAAPESATYWGSVLTFWNDPIEAHQAAYVTAWLSLSRIPVPHWVLNIVAQSDHASITNTNVMVDMVGCGPGAGDDLGTGSTVGSSLTHGHYRVKSIWSRQDFLSTTSSAVFSDPQMFQGSADVNGGPVSLYLTSTGLSGGTSVFNSSDVPAVRVFGDDTVGSYTTAGDCRTWKPSSMGTGNFWISSTKFQNTNYQQDSRVRWDAGASRWYVEIYGRATFLRTFYVFAFGRRA